MFSTTADARITPAKPPLEVTGRVAWIVIVGMTLLTFFPLFHCDFTSWDDEPFIAKNPRFVNPSFENAAHYWTRPFIDIYIPVPATAWMILAAAGRADHPAANGELLNPYLFHAANVLLHAMAGIAAFEMLRRLLRARWPALAGALFFALHPIQVETVGWISGLKDLLGGLFSLCAIAAYCSAVQAHADGRGAKSRYLFATALFALALLSKPSVMTTAGIVGAIDLLFFRRRWRIVLAWITPWLLLAAACAIAAKLMQPLKEGVEFAPIWSRPLICGHAIAFYLGKLFWPANLGIDYGLIPGLTIKTTGFWLAWLVPIALLIAAVAAYRRSAIPLLALAIFVLGPFAMLGWVPFDFASVSITADHYLYTGLLGAALLFGWIVSRLPRSASIGTVAVVVIALAIRSFLQTGVWRDSESLLTHAIEVNPQSWAARTSLAALEVDRGHLQAGLNEAQHAIELSPTYALPWVVVGSVKAQTGDLPGATAAYRRAAELSPTSRILTNLGGILAQQQQFGEAVPILERATQLDPENALAATNLGGAYLQQDRPTEAEQLLRRAVNLNPFDIRSRTNLALALLALHRRPEAFEQLQAAHELRPDDPGLNSLLQQLGFPQSATP